MRVIGGRRKVERGDSLVVDLGRESGVDWDYGYVVSGDYLHCPGVAGFGSLDGQARVQGECEEFFLPDWTYQVECSTRFGYPSREWVMPRINPVSVVEATGRVFVRALVSWGASNTSEDYGPLLGWYIEEEGNWVGGGAFRGAGNDRVRTYRLDTSAWSDALGIVTWGAEPFWMECGLYRSGVYWYVDVYVWPESGNRGDRSGIGNFTVSSGDRCSVRPLIGRLRHNLIGCSNSTTHHQFLANIPYEWERVTAAGVISNVGR